MMKKGQSAIEYVFIIMVVSAALIGMARYMSRAVRAHLAKTTDELGNQTGSMPDSAGFVQENSVIATESSNQILVEEGIGGTRSTTSDEFSTSYGNSISITEQEI
jgi:hypothetical protein